MDQSGFLGLISKDNMLAPLLLERGSGELTGFEALNDFFSVRLFPSISTLMPNLVYCYIIFALTWEQEEMDLGEMLGRITEAKPDSGGESLLGRNRGFHRKGVSENVAGTYRSFMRRYGFLETADPEFKRINERHAGRAKNGRYRSIRSFAAGSSLKTPLEDVLTPAEQRDMQDRCLMRMGLALDDDRRNLRQIEGRDQEELSLFDFIIYRNLFRTKSAQRPLVFEDLSLYFHDLTPKDFKLLGKERVLELKKVYEAARFASFLQYFIKLRRNELIRMEKRKLFGDSKAEPASEAYSYLCSLSADCFPEGLTEIFDESEEGLRGLMEQLCRIRNSGREGKRSECDALIRELTRDSAAEKETALSIREVNAYHDTYRWEYRPTQDLEERRKNVGKDLRCASYFMGEIFGNCKK